VDSHGETVPRPLSRASLLTNVSRGKQARVLAVVTAGGGQDVIRARRLSADLDLDSTVYVVDRTSSRRACSAQLWKILTSEHWDLVYQEGTGIVGGLNLIRAAVTRKQAYIVSSGDPVGGYFRTTAGPVQGWFFERYERFLYRNCAGFVGWTPYLTGMALKMGARRAVTVEGGVDLDVFRPLTPAKRVEGRWNLGLNPDHLVCGVVGSLQWSRRQSYCYGLELVETLRRLKRQDVSLLIVGDGDGRDRLESLIPQPIRSRVVFTGRLSQEQVVCAIQAMDVGFVTQTLDGLGSYRLTTKLPEYLACGVPVAMSPTPGFYDYVSHAGWALPPFHPGRTEFHVDCAKWLDGLSQTEISNRARHATDTAAARFDYKILSTRFRSFVEDLMNVACRNAGNMT
jgi:glycosyltransferase involved in cell wall biosynthesis